MQFLDRATCERLKAVGFPQDTEFWYCAYKDAESDYGLSNRSAGYSWTDHPGAKDMPFKVACPTLDELIAAIGLNFDGLGQINQGWLARSVVPQRHAWADTALESVAALYLTWFAGRKDTQPCKE